MELSKKMQDAFNEQIKEELFSSYIYLSMSAYCETINLPGFAHWMRLQSQEELEHAIKFYSHINDRGGRVVFQALEQPPVEFEGPTDVFEKTLEHEQYITGKIHSLYDLAMEEKDYASYGLLQWFVDEQIEEEQTATEILELLKMIGDKGQGLVMLDRQLAERG
ncbi:MAG: ferritin [Anaerolineae bacterium]|jgi:ferritin